VKYQNKKASELQTISKHKIAFNLIHILTPTKEKKLKWDCCIIQIVIGVGLLFISTNKFDQCQRKIV
jgi:hypothetical protein